MVLNKIKLECPRCHWIFEVTPPDSKQLVCSLEKPQKDKILKDVKEINRVCRNQKCKELITIYSYTPIDYFSRV